jgi:adenylate cyclase
MATTAGEPPASWRIAGWVVEPATGRMTRDGEAISLEPKVMEVLVHLSRHPGQVVSREELEASVWRGRVVGYDAVTNAIIKLRRAFGDDARHPRVIETLSRKGYRLVAAVEPLPAAGDLPPARPAAARWPGRLRRPHLLLVLALLALSLATAWWVWPPQDPETRMAGADATPLAVLPFDNLSADPDQEYFSNGITEDLITELSRIPGLAVIARGSAFAYRDADSLEQVRRELGVRYILRGSVRREGERVRISARLTDAASTRVLWAERYDAKLEDSLGLQASIANRIAEVLQVRLAADPPGMVRRYGASLEAYDHFLRGLDHYGRRSPDDLALAQAYYERAIALDPAFARAYANLGLVYLRQVIDGWDAPSQLALEQAQALARQARMLDDSLAEVYFVGAFVALFNHDHEGALHELDHALVLRPSYADAHALLAWVLNFAGRPEQAGPALERAVRLNPRMPSAYLLVQAETDYVLGRYDHAISLLEQALEMNPVHPRTHLLLIALYEQVERPVDAQWMVEQLLLLHPRVSLSRLQGAFPFKNHQHLEQLLDALRKAGLPG